MNKQQYIAPSLEVIYVMETQSMLAAVSKAGATDYAGNQLPGSKAIAPDIKDLDNEDFTPMAKKNNLFSSDSWED